MIVNGHGGNYVLKHVAQQSNITKPRLILFPTSDDWAKARIDAGMETSNHEDMHAGELETSILLQVAPESLRPGYEQGDHSADDRRFLNTLGIAAYSKSGIIGQPSLGTQDKGSRALDSLAVSFSEHIAAAG